MTTTNGRTYRVRAILFDMDGTLVNSTAVVERTWTHFAERHGLDAAAVIAACHGRRSAETVAEFVPSGVSVEWETAIIDAEEIEDVEGVVEVEGAAQLLASLPSDRWALVTSADRELAMRRMAAAGLPMPPVTITAEDVVNGKPAPDGYLAAARALGVSPGDCLIFEDAPAGLQAAHASGAPVIAVGTTLQEREFGGEQWIRDFTALRIVEAAEGVLEVGPIGSGRASARSPSEPMSSSAYNCRRSISSRRLSRSRPRLMPSTFFRSSRNRWSMGSSELASASRSRNSASADSFP